MKIKVKMNKSWERSARAQAFLEGSDEPIAAFSLYKKVNKSWTIHLEHDIDYSDTFYLNGNELEYERSKFSDSFVMTDNYTKFDFIGNYNEKRMIEQMEKMLEDKHIRRIIIFNQFNEN